MKLFSYVVDHDNGFAPNPYYGVCTLAHCKFGANGKKNVVELAQKGDWVIGTGGRGKKSVGHGKLIYAMRVDEKLSLKQYYHDPRFQKKKRKKNGSYRQGQGDNLNKARKVMGVIMGVRTAIKAKPILCFDFAGSHGKEESTEKRRFELTADLRRLTQIISFTLFFTPVKSEASPGSGLAIRQSALVQVCRLTSIKAKPISRFERKDPRAKAQREPSSEKIY